MPVQPQLKVEQFFHTKQCFPLQLYTNISDTVFMINSDLKISNCLQPVLLLLPCWITAQGLSHYSERRSRSNHFSNLINNNLDASVDLIPACCHFCGQFHCLDLGKKAKKKKILIWNSTYEPVIGSAFPPTGETAVIVQNTVPILCIERIQDKGCNSEAWDQTKEPGRWSWKSKNIKFNFPPALMVWDCVRKSYCSPCAYHK